MIMKKAEYFVIIAVAVAALSVSVSAQGNVSAAGSGADSSAAARSQPSISQPSQNKQASVQRPTKRTNWSKIKTLFE